MSVNSTAVEQLGFLFIVPVHTVTQLFSQRSLK